MKTKNEILTNFEKAIGKPLDYNTPTMDETQIAMIALQYNAEPIKRDKETPKLPEITETTSSMHPLGYLKDIINALIKSGAERAVFTVKQDNPIQISAVVDCESAEGVKPIIIKYFLAPRIDEDSESSTPYSFTPYAEPTQATD